MFCVRDIIILPMPLLCIVEPLRATTSDSESDIIQAATYSRNTQKQVNIRLYQNRTNVQNQSREIIQPCWKYRGQAEQEQHQTSTDERAAAFFFIRQRTPTGIHDIFKIRQNKSKIIDIYSGF